MSCDEDSVVAFLAGDLSEADERRFDQHLLQCESCWRAVQADRAARFALEKLREPAPAGLQDRVALAVTIAAADAPRPSPSNGGRAFGRRPPGQWAAQKPVARLVAAAAVLVALGAGTFAWVEAGARRQTLPK